MTEAALTIRDDDHAAPAPMRGQAVTPMAMLNQAVERGASLDVVNGLMALYERWEAGQARKAYDAAMAAARAEMPVIAKNRTVDFTSSKGRTHYRHEDLAEVARTVGPILAKHGMSYRFRTSVEGATVFVTCIVSHRDGYFEENTLCGNRDESGNKNMIQAVGSTLTYLQRMTLKASLGLAASDDDDGKASGAAESESAFITEEQVMQLRDLLEAEGKDESRFKAIIKVGNLADIYADKFEAAVALIKQKARNNG